MKCFVCGSKCITRYWKNQEGKIVEITKDCTVCDWYSYPVKVPEKIN